MGHTHTYTFQKVTKTKHYHDCAIYMYYLCDVGALKSLRNGMWKVEKEKVKK